MSFKGGVEITGMDAFREKIRAEIKRHRRDVLSALEAIGDVGVSCSVRCAPVDEGFLAASIEKSVQLDGNLPVVVIRVPLNATASEYAVSMHEDNYSLGPKSQLKQARTGVKIGRKYIVRGIAMARPDINIIIKERLKR